MTPHARLLVAQKIDNLWNNSLVFGCGVGVTATCVSTTGKPGDKRGWCMFHNPHVPLSSPPGTMLSSIKTTPSKYCLLKLNE